MENLENTQSILYQVIQTETFQALVFLLLIHSIMKELIISLQASSEPVDLSSASDAIEAASVDLPFPHNGSYLEYDESEQVYKYSEYGKAHVDPGNDNAQLAFKNLLLQSCDFEQLDEHGYMIYNCIASNQDGLLCDKW